MSTEDRIQEIVASGVIAVLPIERGEDVLPIAEAIVEAGGSAVEVVPASLDLLGAIGQARTRLGRRLLLGVGGIVGGDAAWEVIRAGVAFVGSPHLDPEVLRLCREEDVPALPSVLTPTEMAHAWDLGAGAIKIYPAGALGPEYVRLALRGLPPNPAVAAGGIPVERVGDFLRAGVAAVGVEIEVAPGTPGDAIQALGRHIRAFVDAVRLAQDEGVRSDTSSQSAEEPDGR